MTGRRARGARVILLALVAGSGLAVTASGSAAAAGPCDPIVKRSEAVTKLFQRWTQQAYSDGVITPAEYVQSDFFYKLSGKITADLTTCLQTNYPPLEYLGGPTWKRVKPPSKKPLGKKARDKGRKAAIAHTIDLAKQARALGKQGPKVQRKYEQTESGPAGRKFVDFLVKVKDFSDAKDKLQAEYQRYFGKKQPKKFDLSKYEGATGAARKAQLAQIPQFGAMLNKLSDFRNVAVRAALDAEKRDPEIQASLNRAAVLYKDDYATFDTLTAKEKGDVATQWGQMIQTGAAKRLVNEMVEAGKSGTNVVYAH